jgi:membrane-associated phospholipid phosphatase
MRGSLSLFRKLELYEVVGLIVSAVALALFVGYGEALDARQGVPGWHWHPVLWIWDIYRQFIPKAIATALGVLLAIGWWRHRSLTWGVRQTLTILRLGLPFCVLLIIYRALNFYIPLFSPVDRDDWLQQVDGWIFGTQPSLWLQPYIRPWLSDLFSVAYMMWFPMIFFTLLLMMLKSRKAVASYLASALFAFYIGYVCYTLVPAVGPIYALQDVYQVTLQGGAITEFQQRVSTDDLSYPRDVFPSLHTAISCVMFYYVWKYRRPWLWVYAPVVVAILCSTVYLRYHYVIDVFAGMGLAAFTCWLGQKGTEAWNAWRAGESGATGLQGQKEGRGAA